jgi:hypothetical protein
MAAFSSQELARLTEEAYIIPFLIIAGLMHIDRGSRAGHSLLIYPAL